MSLEHTVVKEIPYPTVMEWPLAERWAESIPAFSENDPSHPEWPATPTIPVDFSNEGYGLVYVKNEAHESNPTRTIKDRAAWELVTLYRDFARGLWLKRKKGILDGNISRIQVPRLSIITAGNVGKALSYAFEKYNLPPVKLLVDGAASRERLERMKKLHADVYSTNLQEKPLTTDEIKRLTNNESGIEITSVRIIEPHATFYDWHVHEVFNERPDEIYVPYGSGRIMENYLVWQARTMRNDATRRRDPRLKLPSGHVIGISVLGAEPELQTSVADKLTKPFNPFTMFTDEDISALLSLSFTGSESGVYDVAEERIHQAYDLLSKHVATEPSASAGLALYLQRFDEGKINPRKKILIVNTGKEA